MSREVNPQAFIGSDNLWNYPDNRLAVDLRGTKEMEVNKLACQLDRTPIVAILPGLRPADAAQVGLALVSAGM